MSAYAIVQVDVKDAEEYGKYAVLAGPAVAQYGGEFLARGGAVEVMEGTTRDRCVSSGSPTWPPRAHFITAPNIKRPLASRCPYRIVITNLSKGFSPRPRVNLFFDPV
jgi:hypothetical protein